MTQVHWRCCTQREVPADFDWLHPSERAVLDSLRFEKRRRDWLRGRWNAKRALSELPEACWAAPGFSPPAPQFFEYEIRAAGDGAPEVFVRARRASISISISHRDDLALCALSLETIGLGCDLERIEQRSRVFVADYFTQEEREFVDAGSADARALLANAIWSAKESALKALRTGLRRDTRSVVVRPLKTLQKTWTPIKVFDVEGQATLPGWVNIHAGHVLTVVADAAVDRPVQMPLVPCPGEKPAST